MVSDMRKVGILGGVLDDVSVMECRRRVNSMVEVLIFSCYG